MTRLRFKCCNLTIWAPGDQWLELFSTVLGKTAETLSSKFTVGVHRPSLHSMLLRRATHFWKHQIQSGARNVSLWPLKVGFNQHFSSSILVSSGFVQRSRLSYIALLCERLKKRNFSRALRHRATLRFQAIFFTACATLVEKTCARHRFKSERPRQNLLSVF